MMDFESRALLDEDEGLRGADSEETLTDESVRYPRQSSWKSQEASTSRRNRQDSVHMIEDGITLSWKDIRVSADINSKGGCCSCFNRNKEPKETKPILKGVNGVVHPGSFLVIMGASGSGKTTLLNVLTRRNLGRLNVEGQILANGRPLGEEINSVSGYIQQDDLFVGTLTVGEHLWFNAVLRMGKDVSDEKRRSRIADVMEEMSLRKCENTVIGIPGMVKGISGGEKKRLAFAAELLTRPPILFCDEPTSGLDSFMAQNIVESLKYLATKGHTILCTIHQPSSEVFDMFENILLMAEGNVAFMGTTRQLERFFSEMGYVCPKNYNPADFFIMNLAIVPGQEKECREKVKGITDSFEESNICKEINHQIIDQETLGKDVFMSEMEKFGFRRLTQSDDDDNKGARRKYESSWWKQFSMCLWRTSIDARRNKRVLPARIIQILCSAVVVGLLWFQQPYTLAGVANIDGAMLIFMIQVSVSTCYVIATAFAMGLPVFFKEHDDRQYSVSAYYLGKLMFDLPVLSLASFLYASISYWMVGLNPNPGHFLIHASALVLINLVSAGYAHIFASITPNVEIALNILSLINGMTMLCCGIFIKENSLPLVFKPIAWLSAYRYVYEILVINQWADVAHLGCEYHQGVYKMTKGINLTDTTDDNAPLVEAEEVTHWCSLTGLDVVSNIFHYDPNHIPVCFVVVVAIYIALETLGYMALRRNAQNHT